jgi:TP901-1 family phage major tail protein
MADEQAGIQFLIAVRTAVGPPEVFTVIGGQKTGTLTRNNATVDASHKTSGNWKTKLPGPKEWGISSDIVSVKNDAGAAALEAAYDNSEQVKVEFRYPDNAKIYTGMATIANLTLATPDEGPATYSLELEGAGVLTPSVPTP